MPSFMRNRIEVVSSASIGAARRKLWAKTWSIGPHRSIMPSTACTPIGISPPHGVSALSARQWLGLMNSTLGNVIVASTCRMVPSSPRADHVAQLDHLGMEPAIIAEAERDAGLAHRGDGVFRLLLGQRERLLAEHVLVGGRRGDHLRAMHRMRRRQNHRIDARIGEHRLVIRREPKPFLLGEGFDFRRHGARRAGDEADRVAVARPIQRASCPTSQARRWPP